MIETKFGLNANSCHGQQSSLPLSCEISVGCKRVRSVRRGLLLALAMLVSTTNAVAADWFDRAEKWHGFDQFHFKVADRNAYLVVPEKAAEGKPWVWRARFPGFHFEMDVELVKRGYHVAYVDVAGLFGSPQAMQIGDALYEFIVEDRRLSAKPVMEGVSRGGLFVYNWTARHPERVSCIYCDTPVLDFKSWPGGHGSGIGSAAAWTQCLQSWNFTEEQASAFEGNPLDHARIIAKHAIPVMHIVSETDVVVPPQENTYELQRRLRKLGHDMQIISVPMGTEKSHGHHFTHPDPQRVVEFIVAHSKHSK